jgi:hypothetical protein
VPHSNFADVLTIEQNSGNLIVNGPFDFDPEKDQDIISVVVTAWVAQAPETPHAGEQQVQGTTCSGVFAPTDSTYETAPETPRWEFSAPSVNGSFRTGWAYGTANLIYQRSGGSVETYVWSQWVWLRAA